MNAYLYHLAAHDEGAPSTETYLYGIVIATDREDAIDRALMNTKRKQVVVQARAIRLADVPVVEVKHGRAVRPPA